jgi:dihydropteroate synthase
MGIVNVTPDSFSDGGHFFDPQLAVAHGLSLVAEGADILDIGAESSRPGAIPISTEEELRRILPVVIELARQVTVPISIDTWKAPVAEACLDAGGHIINDITALQGDPALAQVVLRYRAGLVLMHMRGTPQTMQVNPAYADVVAEVANFLEARLRWSADLGIAGNQVVLDPGIGFGKTVDHNLELVANLGNFATRLNRPLCLGASRKGFLGKVLGRDLEPKQRLAGSLAVACYALAQAAPAPALVIRAHDVAATRDAVLLFAALDRFRSSSPMSARPPSHLSTEQRSDPS